MKRLLFPFTLVTCLLAAQSASAAATIEGTVKIYASKSGSAASKRYAGEGKVAKPREPVAVVWIEGKFPASSAAPKKVEVGQRDLRFDKKVVAVQVGGEVSFPNYDDEYHNVFSFTKTKRFDLGRYRKGETPPPVKFDKAGVVKLWCEIHSHMRATIVVVDSPHYTTSTPDGKFKLGDLPAGNYTLKAWNGKRTLEKPVQLQDGQTLKIDFGSK